MKVEKKELADRIFTPYIITITITNEHEHDEFIEDIQRFKAKYDNNWDRFGSDSAILKLLQTLDNTLYRSK